MNKYNYVIARFWDEDEKTNNTQKTDCVFMHLVLY